MLDDPRVIQAAIAGTITAAVGFGLVLPAIRKLPMQQLQKGTDPKPADPGIRASKALGLSNWQSGIIGPKDKSPQVLPYLGKHILALDDDRVAVRAGGGTHHWRFVLFVMLLAIPFAVAIALELLDMVTFLSRGGGTCIRDFAASTGLERSVTDLSGTPWNYVYHRYCTYANVLLGHSILNETQSTISLLLDIWLLPITVIVLIPVIAILTILRKTPPPLVFDRRRKLVYTYYKGQVWTAPWDGLQMRTFVGAFITTPAFALYENGTGKGAWFVLAGYHAWKEPRAWRLNTLNLNWMGRWDGMRCWLVVFMEQGRADLHPRFVGRGFGDLIAPRQAQLPADIDALVDQLRVPAGQKDDMQSSMAALLRQGERRVLSSEDCNLKVAD